MHDPSRYDRVGALSRPSQVCLHRNTNDQPQRWHDRFCGFLGFVPGVQLTYGMYATMGLEGPLTDAGNSDGSVVREDVAPSCYRIYSLIFIPK